MFKKVCLFSGNANPELAAAIGQYLETPLGKCRVTRFTDGESFVEIGENVRGVDAFVIQPTCSPTNDNVMELLIMVDALRRASAGSITAVIPYYGYARQDRKVAPRTPITCKLVADLIQAAGRQPRRLGRPARRADPGLLQHPLRSPLRDAGLPRGLPARSSSTRRPSSSRPTPAASSARARTPSGSTPSSPSSTSAASGPTCSEVMNLIGEVKGKDCIIIDDIIDTAGTLCRRRAGARRQGRASASSPARPTACSRARPSSASPSRR